MSRVKTVRNIATQWLSGFTPGEIAKAPLTKGTLAVAGAAGLAGLELEVGHGVADAMNGSEMARAEEIFALQRRIQAREQAQRMESERVSMGIERNLQILAQNAPDVYNRVLAGRPLLPGAVVLGGRPRRDLLRELAMMMTDGALGPPAQAPGMPGMPGMPGGPMGMGGPPVG